MCRSCERVVMTVTGSLAMYSYRSCVYSIVIRNVLAGWSWPVKYCNLIIISYPWIDAPLQVARINSNTKIEDGALNVTEFWEKYAWLCIENTRILHCFCTLMLAYRRFYVACSPHSTFQSHSSNRPKEKKKADNNHKHRKIVIINTKPLTRFIRVSLTVQRRRPSAWASTWHSTRLVHAARVKGTRFPSRKRVNDRHW